MIPRLITSGRAFVSYDASVLDLLVVGLVISEIDEAENNHWFCKRCFASAMLFGDPETDLAERNKWIDELRDEVEQWSEKQWIEARTLRGFELLTLHLHRDLESVDVYGDELEQVRACGWTKQGEECSFPVVSESAQWACEHLRKRLSAIGTTSAVPADRLFDDCPNYHQYRVRPSFDESRYRMTIRLA